VQYVVVGPFTGLRYETVHRQPGPSDAERKLDELTRQLEVEMSLGSSPSTQSICPHQRSPVFSGGVPLKPGGSSLPVSLQRAKHSQPRPTCGKCVTVGEWTVVVFPSML